MTQLQASSAVEQPPVKGKVEGSNPSLAANSASFNSNTTVSPHVSNEKLAEIIWAARMELARRYAKAGDILSWGKVVFPEKFPLNFCEELHGYFVSIRAAPLTSTEAPRNHAKSTIKCFLIPIFQALEEPNTFNHYLNVQATGLKAFAVNIAIKAEIENSSMLRALYGNQIGSDKWTDGQFVLKNGTIFTAVGAGQSIRGLNYRNVRPDYIIVDDLYDEEDINNPEATVKKNEWFWGSLYPARAKSRTCSIHVQGTAINAEDLLEELKGKALEHGGRWHCKSFSACNMDTKEVLWKELNTFEHLMADMKDMPIVIFMREMQNVRRDNASSIVKSEWLEAWEYDPADLKFNGSFQYVSGILGIDPSIGKKEENDPAGYAFVLKGQRDDGTLPIYYIEGLTNKCMTLQERVDKAKEYVNNRPPDRPATVINVETISGFADFGDRVAASVSVPCKMIDHVTDKITHLEKKSHYFQNRRIFLNRNIDPELKKTLKHQLTTNHPKHDDVRDALLHCLDDESANWSSWV